MAFVLGIVAEDFFLVQKLFACFGIYSILGLGMFYISTHTRVRGCLVPVVKEDFHWTNNNTFEKEIVIKYDKTTNSTF